MLQGRGRDHPRALRTSRDHQLHGLQHGPAPARGLLALVRGDGRGLQRPLPDCRGSAELPGTGGDRGPHPRLGQGQAVAAHGALDLGRELAAPQHRQSARRDAAQLPAACGPRRRRRALLPVAGLARRRREVPLRAAAARRHGHQGLARSGPAGPGAAQPGRSQRLGGHGRVRPGGRRHPPRHRRPLGLGTGLAPERGRLQHRRNPALARCLLPRRHPHRLPPEHR